MVKFGTPRNVAVPSAWFGWLRPLTPAEVTAGTRTLPGLGATVDAVFGAMPERERQVLWRRLALNETLATIGQDLEVSGERVRQLALRALQQAQTHTGDLERLSREVLRDPARMIDVSAARSAHRPEASGETLWQVALALLGEDRRFGVRPLPGGLWLAAAPDTLDLRAATKLTEDQPHFRDPVALARTTGTDPAALVPWTLNGTPLYLTQGGRVASRRWSQGTWALLIARTLAEHGQHDWHYSQMAHALEFVRGHPADQVDFRTFPSVLGTVPELRPNGLQGRWGLVSPGDHPQGLPGLITEVLRNAGMPLHRAELHRQVTVRHAVNLINLDRCLHLDPAFVSYGSGLHGLPGMSVPQGSPEERFMLDLLAQTPEQEQPEDAVHAAALAAGLEPWRVQAVGYLSAHYRYRFRTHRYGLARTTQLDQFRRWYGRRQRMKSPPPDAVLHTGLQDAQARNDRTVEPHLRALFAERGWPFPADPA